MTVLLETRVREFAIEVASQVSPEVRILGVDGEPKPFLPGQMLDEARSKNVEGSVGLAQCD
ncbi:MAG TPA: hypothetical protein VFS12_13510 [Terriglobia bacterium]|nr:hypothetical protein [Terriglobia bacterium]